MVRKLCSELKFLRGHNQGHLLKIYSTIRKVYIDKEHTCQIWKLYVEN